MNTLRSLAIACSVSALAVVSACSSSPPRQDPYANAPGAYGNEVQYGNVSGIDIIPATQRTSGGGAVLGAVIGAVVGNQIGSGSGRAAATGLGAVGGAFVGNNIEGRNKGEGEIFRISVRLDNGRTGTFDYQSINDLRIGDRVKVQDGQLHRV